MKRQINFRGKRTDTEEWICGYYLEFTLCDGEGRCSYIKIDGCQPVKVLPETVGQFTGLLDKNGKEIYEGDVLEHVIHPQIYYGTGKDDYDMHKGLTCHYEVIYNPLQTSFETKLIYVSEKEVKVGSVYKTEIAIGDRYSLYSIDGYTPKCKFEIIGTTHDNPKLLKGGKE